MGVYGSKIENSNNYNLLEDDKITVNFVQIKKNSNSIYNVSLEQLNVLLGLNIPKYSIINKFEYPYLFCINSSININNIFREYGYEVGLITKQKVYKNEFNAHYKAIYSYDGENYYKLVRKTSFTNL